MSDEYFKPGREFSSVDEDCYKESQYIVDEVRAAIEFMVSPSKVDKHWALGEAHMRIALRKLLESVLKPGLISVEMEIIKNRWDLEVRYTFCALGRDSITRTTQCVDGGNPLKSAMDLCISTVGCVEFAKRDFMNNWLNSDNYSDFVYALSFACGVGQGLYL
ncbi:MAG: hypothetical protein ACYSW6_07365 [Planctomycetota bacterium]|jgi:hypothetical protein